MRVIPDKARLEASDYIRYHEQMAISRCAKSGQLIALWIAVVIALFGPERTRAASK